MVKSIVKIGDRKLTVFVDAKLGFYQVCLSKKVAQNTDKKLMSNNKYYEHRVNHIFSKISTKLNHTQLLTVFNFFRNI